MPVGVHWDVGTSCRSDGMTVVKPSGSGCTEGQFQHRNLAKLLHGHRLSVHLLADVLTRANVPMKELLNHICSAALQ